MKQILIGCIIILVTLIMLQGCSSNQIVVPAPEVPGPSPSVEVLDLGSYPKNSYDLISEEWEDYPNVKKYFKSECNLQAFAMALAKMESNYKLTTQFVEPKINGKVRYDYVTGHRIVSEGLFQMSYQDAKLWKCGFNYGSDQYMRKENQKLELLTIFRAEVQADCMLKVLERMIKAEGHPFYNRSSVIANYWYPLKPKNDEKHREFQNKYKENQKLFCKN